MLAERGVLDEGGGSGRDERRAAACDRGWRRAAGLGEAVAAGSCGSQSELPHGDLVVELSRRGVASGLSGSASRG